TMCLCGSMNMEIEVHLDRLNNTVGKLADGACCSSLVSRTDGSCIGDCNTFARVCIASSSRANELLQLNSVTCNIAYRITGLVGHNNINGAKDIRFSHLSNNWEVIKIFGLFRLPYTIEWLESLPTQGPFRVILQLYHSPSTTQFNLENSYLIADGSTYEKDYSPSQNWTSHRSWRSDGVELVYSYRIRCPANHYGSSCHRLCVPRDDIVGHFTCDSQGRRVCMPGYTGSLCSKPVCSKNCSSNGICEGPNRCRCLPGWDGPDCSRCVPMPNCSPKHGFCRQPMECECKKGYGGMLCDIDLQWCRNNPNPCENGGRCVNKDGLGYNYTCLCQPGYTGFHCEKELNDCRLTGCANGGTCPSNSSGKKVVADLPPSNALTTATPIDSSDTRCHCRPGFTGRRCQFNITRCSEGPCQGRGRCRDLPARAGGGFACDCDAGWSGQNCEINTDDCKPGYCLNDKFNTAKGSPPSSRANLCRSNPRAKLRLATNRIRCVFLLFLLQLSILHTAQPCEAYWFFWAPTRKELWFDSVESVYMPEDFESQRAACMCSAARGNGQNCLSADLIGQAPRDHGGQCVDGLNKFSCICRHHFAGTRCNVNLLDCRFRCRNGGTCVDRANGLECRCPPGFRGAYCEHSDSGGLHGNRSLGNSSSGHNRSIVGVVEIAAAADGGGGGTTETILLAACGVLLPVTVLLLCLLSAS
uniref:Delta-like protein n=1 Tax=Macrostomum lignano TaxID=282301 RepID=A0A1I8GTR6_9PLAT